MARIRVTFYFKNAQGLGWSETLFSTRGDINLAIADALLLFPKRVNCNGNDVYLFYIRASDDEVKRDAAFVRIPYRDSFSKDPALGDGEDANTCLDVALYAGPIKRGLLFMSGIPDNCVKESGAYVPTTAFQTNFTLWAAALTAGPWGLRSRLPGAAFANITNMVQDGATGIVTVTTALPHGYTNGSYTNILQVGGATRARGVQKVIAAPTLTTFTYRIKMIMQPYTGGGIARDLDYDVNGYTVAQVVRVGHHDRGRPFGAPRGRRRVI